MEMAVKHWGMCHPYQQKIPKYCLTASSGGFVYGTTVVRYNSVINSSTKGSEPGSISHETTPFRQNLLAGHSTSFRVWGC
jgi:hypothetical protein